MVVSIPEQTTFAIEIIEPENRDSSDLADLWDMVKAEPSKGAYQGIFAYKYLELAYEKNRVHGWGMLIWDRLMIFVGHHDPQTPVDAAS